MKLKDLKESPEKKSGTYVAVKFSKDSCNTLKSIAKDLSVPNVIPREKMHCTIMYSKVKNEDIEGDDSLNSVEFDPPKLAHMTAFDIFPSQDGNNCLVVLLDSQYLNGRFEYFRDEHGLVSDYDEFKPHVTLSYNAGEFNPDDVAEDYLSKYVGLEIVHEYIEPLKDFVSEE